MAPEAACLPLQFVPAETSDLELADEIYTCTALLEMGSPSGLGPHVAEDLRRRRAEAARELAARWSA